MEGEGRREQGFPAWAGRDSAGQAAELACRFSCGKHLPHCYTLLFQDLTLFGYVSQAWEVQLAFSPVAFGFPGVISASQHPPEIRMPRKTVVYETRRMFNSVAPLGSGVAQLLQAR